VIASFFPMLFAGSQELLVNLIKEDNEILKKGIAHVLAKVGGTIREELATTSRCIKLVLQLTRIILRNL
jgi:sister chromatid cohesion protein PDS5